MKELQRDPMLFNMSDKKTLFKVYLPSDYHMFGCGFEQHTKYLPCIAILKEHSGDCFYDFDLITEDGLVRSCGYAWFKKIDEIENIKNTCEAKVVGYTINAGRHEKYTLAIMADPIGYRKQMGNNTQEDIELLIFPRKR